MLRIGIAGCGRAARIHLDRLGRLPEVAIVGCADTDRGCAEALAQTIHRPDGAAAPPAAVCTDHQELLRLGLDALCIFTPHRWHYRLAMDALQAGCHVFIEKPLSTNLQEAADIVALARGRALKVAVGHQYRLCPSLAEARRLLRESTIGTWRMITATLARPWPDAHPEASADWRRDPGLSGGGVLADAGDHLLDALLWTTGQSAQEAFAIQTTLDSGIDWITAAAIRLSNGTPATVAVSGAVHGPFFELNVFGDSGRMRITEQTVELDGPGESQRQLTLPAASESIDANFVAALTQGTSLCCPAEQALETVRLLEALMRSATTGQRIRLGSR